MKEKYKYLSKNVFLFTLSGFVPKILSFILIPIYTGYLSPADYGISDLIVTTAMLLVPIFTLDIQDAVMRYALDKSYDNADVLSIAIKIILKGSLIVTGISVLLSLLNINGLENTYLLFIVIMFLTSSLSNTFSLFCRGIDKIKILTIGSILNSGVMLISNILFLVCFKWGLNGFLVANSLGALANILFIFIFAKLWRFITFRDNKDVRKQMIAFSFPLIFSVIAWWINNASDRYVLTWISGVSISGVYAISYKIPNLLSMFQNIFTQAWSVSAIKEFDKKDTDGFIGNMFTLMNCSMVIVCSIILIFNVPLAYILYSNEFFLAWKNVPPLLISVVFNAMALFIGSLFTAVKDTKTLAVSTLVGAVMNIIFNFLLIYYFQAYGAAIATLIGYLVTFIIRYNSLRKYIKMKVNMKREAGAYVVLILQMMVSCLGVISIIIQPIFLILIFVIYKKEIKKIVEILLRKIGKSKANDNL